MRVGNAVSGDLREQSWGGSTGVNLWQHQNEQKRKSQPISFSVVSSDPIGWQQEGQGGLSRGPGALHCTHAGPSEKLLCSVWKLEQECSLKECILSKRSLIKTSRILVSVSGMMLPFIGLWLSERGVLLGKLKLTMWWFIFGFWLLLFLGGGGSLCGRHSRW